MCARSPCGGENLSRVHTILGTLLMSLSKKRALAMMVSVVSVFIRVRDASEEHGSLKATWPSLPMPEERGGGREKSTRKLCVRVHACQFCACVMRVALPVASAQIHRNARQRQDVQDSTTHAPYAQTSDMRSSSELPRTQHLPPRKSSMPPASLIFCS